MWLFLFPAICLKFIGNVCFRFGNIYAPFLASELNMDVESFLHVVAVCAAAGIMNAFLSPLFDVVSPRAMFCFGEIVVLTGFGFAACKNYFALVQTGWIMFFSGSYIIAASVQAILTRFVPVNELSKFTSYIELSWPFSGLVGVPLVGIILQRLSWSWLYIIFAGIHLPAALILCYAVFSREMPSVFIPPMIDSASQSVTPMTMTPARKRQVDVTTKNPIMSMTGAAFPSAYEECAAIENVKEEKGLISKSVGSIKSLRVSKPRNYGSTTESQQRELTLKEVLVNSFTLMGEVVFDRRCFAFMFATMSLACSSNCMAQSFGMWLVDIGYDAEVVGSLTFVFGAGEIAGNIICGRLAKYYSPRELIYLSSFSYIFFLCATAIIQYFHILIYVPLVGYFLSALSLEILMIGLISFGSTYGEVSNGNVGTVMCLFWASMSSGFMIATVIVTPIYDFMNLGVPSCLIVGACLITLGALFIKMSQKYDNYEQLDVSGPANESL